jgi:hypothetical protein
MIMISLHCNFALASVKASTFLSYPNILLSLLKAFHSDDDDDDDVDDDDVLHLESSMVPRLKSKLNTEILWHSTLVNLP